MTPIQLMALFVAVLATIKLLVIIIKPKAWLNVIKFVYAKPVLTSYISLIFAILSLAYLLREITIIQIFAVMLLFMFLMLMSISAHAKEIGIVGLAKKLLKDGLLEDGLLIKKAWLPILVWIILLTWLFFALFA